MSEENPIAQEVGPAADPAKVGKQALRARDREKRDLEDVRLMLSSLPGRRFFWRYMKKCSVFESAFNNSGSVTAFNLGMQNIGLMLLADINTADPGAYLKMLEEAKQDSNGGQNG